MKTNHMVLFPQRCLYYLFLFIVCFRREKCLSQEISHALSHQSHLDHYAHHLLLTCFSVSKGDLGPNSLFLHTQSEKSNEYPGDWFQMNAWKETLILEQMIHFNLPVNINTCKTLYFWSISCLQQLQGNERGVSWRNDWHFHALSSETIYTNAFVCIILVKPFTCFTHTNNFESWKMTIEYWLFPLPHINAVK